jgi:hypothetical protein
MEIANKAARVCQILIGFVYIVSGVIKVWEPVLFYWEAIPFTQILGLGPESWTFAAKAAVVLGPVEMALGLALVLNWRPKFTMPIATLLMVFFTGLMLYAWNIGATIDCGCFGALVERSPGEAAVEDVVMLFMLVFAWWGTRKRVESLVDDELGEGIRPWANKAVLGMLAASLVLCGARFFPEIERLEASDLKSGVRLIGLSLEGTDVDLTQGKYLLEIFSPVCGHCIDAVPKINVMAADGDLPRVVALTNFTQDAPQLIEFKKRFSPQYDIATISKTDYFRLTYAHGYPRLAYIEDGVVQSVWERDFMPTVERLKEFTR